MGKNTFLTLMISLVIIILFITLFINRILPPANLEILEQSTQKVNIEFENLNLGTNPGAEINFIEFGDFKCPYCAQMAPDISKLIESYPQINYIYKHFPPDNDESPRAAIASECARAQNKFLEYHDILFERQIDFSYNKLLGFANELNLNIDDFKDCMENFHPLEKIENDIKEAQLANVKGTPTLFINNRRLDGVQPYSNLRLLIEQELIRVK